MLLALDAGNSNIVLALFDAGGPATQEPVASWRLTTNKHQTVDEYSILFRELFAMRQIPMESVQAIVISSVVPPLDTALRQVCEQHFKIKPLFVEPGVKTGLPVLVDSPAEVGADRIVNCVAAFEKYGGPCIVVDLGTATTFDVVSARGEFLGGAIAPGLEISADALFEQAAKLPRVDVKRPAKIIGTSTTDNIQIGLFYGYIGLVDGILERMIAELGPETKLVATGGLARLIAGGSKYISEVDPMLTMTGLRIVHERNAERGRRRPAAASATTAPHA
jgi:type III pantothenate kinase